MKGLRRDGELSNKVGIVLSQLVLENTPQGEMNYAQVKSNT